MQYYEFKSMNPYVIFSFLLVVCCFFFALYIVEGIKRENSEEKMLRIVSGHDSVEPREYLLTVQERDFFRYLQIKFSDKYLIFTQVSLSALVQIKENQKDKYERRGLIDKFYVDFVLCSKDDIKPRLVIELNDKTHELSNRKERDQYIEALLKSADLKLFFCPSGQKDYDVYLKDIQNRLVELNS